MKDVLTEKEIKVINFRNGFDGIPHTLQETGKVFGVQQERIRQIEAKAEEKLRQNPKFSKLKIDYD